MTRKPAGRVEGTRPATTTPSAAHTVPERSDILARRIRLHHQLVRRRRWSKQLDRICGRAA